MCSKCGCEMEEIVKWWAYGCRDCNFVMVDGWTSKDTLEDYEKHIEEIRITFGRT